MTTMLNQLFIFAKVLILKQNQKLIKITNIKQ